MSNKVNLEAYQDFVQEVTSAEANELASFIDRLDELSETTECNIPLFLNSAIGIAAEGGEFAEIPKKVCFQGKPLDEETIFHAKRELGDIIWYWMNACRSLNLDPNEVIAENVHKLKSRYPGGEFDVHYSEHRQDGDL
jgi:NTP pyrophosphatase (non-canonical NTP hydrolase)|tara:strand:- start:176 stop:589 length:414 start_codon:yes stop_codon:yes gene_type:complete